MRAPVFAGRKLLGHVTLSPLTAAAIETRFERGRPFAFPLGAKAKRVITFIARKPDQEAKYRAEWLSSYGVEVLGMHGDIFNLLFDGEL